MSANGAEGIAISMKQYDYFFIAQCSVQQSKVEIIWHSLKAKFV